MISFLPYSVLRYEFCCFHSFARPHSTSITGHDSDCDTDDNSACLLPQGHLLVKGVVPPRPQPDTRPTLTRIGSLDLRRCVVCSFFSAPLLLIFLLQYDCALYIHCCISPPFSIVILRCLHPCFVPLFASSVGRVLQLAIFALYVMFSFTLITSPRHALLTSPCLRPNDRGEDVWALKGLPCGSVGAAF